MNVPSVGFNSKIFDLKILPEGIEINLNSFTVQEKNVNSLQFRPYKRNKVRRWFCKTRTLSPHASVGFNSKIFDLKILPEGIEINLNSFTVQEKM